MLQCIPHVLAMTSDQVADIRNKAELQLIDVNKQHPTFIQVYTAPPYLVEISTFCVVSVETRANFLTLMSCSQAQTEI